MSQTSKSPEQASRRLEQAFDAVRGMTPEQQELMAAEILERAQALCRPATALDPQERAELEAELAAARRGELASDDELAAVYAKHGL